MAAETQYTVNTGMTTISAANTSLTGSGTLNTDIWSVITGASNGTVVKSVTIKAKGSTTAQGMVRLFIYDGANTSLFAEVEIPIVTQSAIDTCFEKYLELDLDLKSGYEIRATTQIADTFNIIAEGLNWSYYASSVRTDTTQIFMGNTGSVAISTANSALDGTGTIGTVLTAGTTANGYKGCKINSITIKAMQTTTKGMVRLFVKDTGTTTKLLAEIPVLPTTYNAVFETFGQTVSFNNALCIAPGYKILATTEKGESFFVSADAEDWNYLA
jgi:hypothetical protein